MLSSLEFFIVEAFRSIRRSALMSFVAIATIIVSLTIFGLFLLLIMNLGNIVGGISSRMDLVAYIYKDLSLDDAGMIQIKISNIPGVEKVEFTSKTEAWNNFKDEFNSKLNLNDVVYDNPLPHTYMVRVRNADMLPQVAKEISSIDVVDEVRYNGKLIQQIKSLISAVRVGGTALVVMLSLATLLIVVNTIRLTVIARETDIYIMKLVGATDNFVKWPFIIEGIIIGVIGGLTSLLILKLSYEAVVSRILQALPFLPLITDYGLLLAIYTTMFFGGTALGMIGGYISVSRVLKDEMQ
ncbi:MAG: permease-like cell division protein FtsX [Candidatus Margulisbacteria bacterium]|nr:permease-like cell division protein FtsX [Candidatus Margulisiibacteriota bacterium]MBU1616788.1 permease-like cell division protein FtsX [Candidatus Margulisiibacteriota bacterium]